MKFEQYAETMSLAERTEQNLNDLEDRLLRYYAGGEGSEEQAERIRQIRRLLGSIQKDLPRSWTR